MLEPGEPALLQCLAPAFLWTTINHQNFCRSFGRFDDGVDPSANAGQAVHLTRLVTGHLSGGTVGQTAHIGSTGACKYEFGCRRTGALWICVHKSLVIFERWGGVRGGCQTGSAISGGSVRHGSQPRPAQRRQERTTCATTLASAVGRRLTPRRGPRHQGDQHGSSQNKLSARFHALTGITCPPVWRSHPRRVPSICREYPPSQKSRCAGTVLCLPR